MRPSHLGLMLVMISLMGLVGMVMANLSQGYGVGAIILMFVGIVGIFIITSRITRKDEFDLD